VFSFDINIKDHKRFFFDRETVARRLDRAKQKKFSILGGVVRKIARRSMRNISKAGINRIAKLRVELARLKKRKNQSAYVQGRQKVLDSQIWALERKLHSPPGKPPKVIQGNIKRLLFYSLDPQKGSVVIGPAKLAGSNDAPAIQEYGGFVTTKAGGRRAAVLPRPFMGPAKEKAEPIAANLFRDSL
jgi:hypothetical protein